MPWDRASRLAGAGRPIRTDAGRWAFRDDVGRGLACRGAAAPGSRRVPDVRCDPHGRAVGRAGGHAEFGAALAPAGCHRSVGAGWPVRLVDLPCSPIPAAVDLGHRQPWPPRLGHAAATARPRGFRAAVRARRPGGSLHSVRGGLRRAPGLVAPGAAGRCGSWRFRGGRPGDRTARARPRRGTRRATALGGPPTRRSRTNRARTSRT